MPKLFKLHEQNPDIKVSISAEMLAMHGDVISVLDKVRTAGIKKVGYQIRAAANMGAPPPGALESRISGRAGALHRPLRAARVWIRPNFLPARLFLLRGTTMNHALLYRPGSKWTSLAALSAAAIVHLSAVAFGSWHREAPPTSSTLDVPVTGEDDPEPRAHSRPGTGHDS